MIYVTQKKLHAKKEEKLLKRFWDRPPPPLNLDGRTDGRTDRWTDRRTTDKSVLEKLRCLSAGGAKKGTILTFWPLKNNLYSDSTKSFLWYVGNVIPKKLHAKKEKKLLKRFWDWPFPPLKLTPTPPTPTPPTTTDKSAFEKLRCQMAQRS